MSYSWSRKTFPAWRNVKYQYGRGTKCSGTNRGASSIPRSVIFQGRASFWVVLVTVCSLALAGSRTNFKWTGTAHRKQAQERLCSTIQLLQLYTTLLLNARVYSYWLLERGRCHRDVLKPKSWTYNFVEDSGQNLESSQTWGFCIQCLHYKPVSNHCCSKGGGGVKSVSRGDCE